MSPTVIVKPLIWTRNGPLLSWHGRVGEHVIAGIDGEQLLGEHPPQGGWFKLRIAPRHDSRHPTLEAAQAKAQEQWEAFVRAAIEITFPPVADTIFATPAFLGRSDLPAPDDGLYVGCRIVMKPGYGEYFQGGERGTVTALNASWVEVDCIPGVRISRFYVAPADSP